jgi:hypothetical protein
MTIEIKIINKDTDPSRGLKVQHIDIVVSQNPHGDYVPLHSTKGREYTIPPGEERHEYVHSRRSLEISEVHYAVPLKKEKE